MHCVPVPVSLQPAPPPLAQPQAPRLQPAPPLPQPPQAPRRQPTQEARRQPPAQPLTTPPTRLTTRQPPGQVRALLIGGPWPAQREGPAASTVPAAHGLCSDCSNALHCLQRSGGAPRCNPAPALHSLCTVLTRAQQLTHRACCVAGVMTAGAAHRHQPGATAQRAPPTAGPHPHQPGAALHAAPGPAAQPPKQRWPLRTACAAVSCPRIAAFVLAV